MGIGVAIRMGMTQPSEQLSLVLDSAHEPRLNTTLSLREPTISLHELMRKLSRETGLDLRVGDSIRYFRACLLVNERPLHETLQRLADTFSFRWTRQKTRDGKEYYLLLEPREARAERERLTQFLAVLREKEPADILREALARIPDFAFRLSYEEYLRVTGRTREGEAQPKEPDPRLLPLLKPASAPLPRDLQAIYDRYLNRLAREILLNYSALYLLGNLSEDEWQQFRRYEQLLLSPDRLPIEALEQYREAQLKPYEEAGIASQLTLQRLRLTCSEEALTIFMIWEQRWGEQPRNRGTIALGTAHLSMSSAQRVLDDALEAFRSEVREPLPALDCRLPSTIEPAILQAWLHLPAYLLLSGADACKINLVGEWSPLWFAMTAGQYLDTSWAGLLRCLARGYTLTLDEQWLMIQARLPALARALDISEMEFQRWLAHEGLIDIESAIAMDQRLLNAQINALRWLRAASLLAQRLLLKEPPPQLGQQLSYIEGVIMIDPLYNSLGELLSSSTRRLLRFYAHLNAAQRATLKRGMPIRFEQLNSVQQGELGGLLMRENASVQTVPFAKLRLEPVELPMSLFTLRSYEGVLQGAWYSFSSEVAREAGIPFVQGCQFTIELPDDTPNAPMRRLQFPLLLSLK